MSDALHLMFFLVVHIARCLNGVRGDVYRKVLRVPIEAHRSHCALHRVTWGSLRNSSDVFEKPICRGNCSTAPQLIGLLLGIEKTT